MAKVYYCVEMPTAHAARGATYGCSLKRSEAEAALARGQRRGMTKLVIAERPTRPKHVKGWAPPLEKR